MLNRAPLLFVNRDPDFFEEVEHRLERRGTALYTAATVAEVGQLLHAQRFKLTVVNAASAHFSPDSIQALHTALRRRNPRSSLVVVTPREQVDGFHELDLPDTHLLIPPLKHGFLLELSSRLTGLATRRSASSVAQVFPPEGNMLIGFLVDVSRHGVLMRLDHGPDEEDPSVALRFVLAGTKGQNEVRARLVRTAGYGTDRRYAFEFTDVDEDAQTRLNHFVAQA